MGLPDPVTRNPWTAPRSACTFPGPEQASVEPGSQAARPSFSNHMNLNVSGVPGVFLFLLPLVWWGVVTYFILRFLQAFERGVRAHEDVAREVRRLSERLGPHDRTGGAA